MPRIHQLVDRLAVDPPQSPQSYQVTLSELKSHLDTSPDDLDLDTIEALSQHANPYLSWCSSEGAALVMEIVDTSCPGRKIDDFVEEKVVPRMQTLPSSQKTTSAGYAAKRTLGGLKPRLGFTQSEPEPSTPETTYSMIYFCISCQHKGTWYSSRWSLVTSFVLKVLDNPSAVIKIQGCRLLDHFLLFPQATSLLDRTGLRDLFSESTKVCLTYLPGLTPLDQSLPLLDIAYGVMFKLEGKNVLKMLDLLSGILRAILSKINEPEIQNSKYKLPILLLQKLKECLGTLEHRFVASLSRINYTINQVIVNPGATEHEMGAAMVSEAVKVQLFMISTAESYGNECLKLVTSYKLDMLGAWAVALKRFDDENLPKAIQEGYRRLKQLDEKDEQLQKAVSAISTNFNVAFT
jgi:hypothetical protein